MTELSTLKEELALRRSDLKFTQEQLSVDIAKHNAVLQRYEEMNKIINLGAGQAAKKEKEILTAKGQFETIKIELSKFVTDFMNEITNFEEEKTFAELKIADLTKKIDEMTTVHKLERAEVTESNKAKEALLEKNFDKYKIDA